MKVLIFAAHPDDEVLGCGATAARLAKGGHEVIPIILCENASVRYEKSEMLQTIETWANQSAKILGISSPVFLRMPDQRLDTYASLDLAQILEKVIRDYQPDTIFTHHGGDINIDHRLVFDATLVATRPTPSTSIRTVYSYETISATEWAYTDFYARFSPTTYFDVTETLDLKVEAFSQYKSEIKDYPHPRSLEAIRIRAKDWGARVGLHASEAFQLIRTVE